MVQGQGVWHASRVLESSKRCLSPTHCVEPSNKELSIYKCGYHDQVVLASVAPSLGGVGASGDISTYLNDRSRSQDS